MSRKPAIPRRPRDGHKTGARDEPAAQTGLVIVNHGRAALVEDESGALHRCTARRNVPRSVSGDRVRWEPSGRGQGVITEVLPRHTVLLRPDGPDKTRAMAANLDRVIIVVATRPSFPDELLDRYLAAAEIIGAEPLLVVNKADLLDEGGRFAMAERLRPFEAIGYRALFTSSLDRDGLKDLHEALRGHTCMLVGQSGVGKSSLVQALLPDLEIRTGALSEATGQGCHTTTVATLYHLPDGGDLIDSPGVRDFDLWTCDPVEVSHGFREFRDYLGQCRFHNCRHLSEPGCAIQEAARSGAIAARRLESYRRIVQAEVP
ncbi:MAG: small ribosomal subunit biogenesis GTPase RsgA [Xanthomonadaceae bacterium]|nr:small ribosomal subunit biogenesis GTPase RsgA [Xanthomonadaceae bacterium]